MDDIYEKLTPIFRDVFDLAELRLAPGMSAADVAGWDSLNHIRLIMSVQRRFGVRFSAAEIGKLRNVGDLAALIRTKLAPSDEALLASGAAG